MTFRAEVGLNAMQPVVIVELMSMHDLKLKLGTGYATLELEQLQTLILALQAAEVQMRSWKPESPRWP